MKNEEGGNSISTVVLRGSTDSILDDLERAVDDGVNTYKVFLYIYCLFLELFGAHTMIFFVRQWRGTAALYLVRLLLKSSWLEE